MSITVDKECPIVPLDDGYLRDQFATAALMGLLSTVDAVSLAHDLEYTSRKWRIHVYTDLAYTLADAMLARRSTPPTAPPSAQPQKEP